MAVASCTAPYSPAAHARKSTSASRKSILSPLIAECQSDIAMATASNSTGGEKREPTVWVR
eukprot:1718428-Rhodomonas_salina.1